MSIKYKYINHDIVYDMVKVKYKDDLQIKLTIKGQESVFDLSGIVVNITTELVIKILEERYKENK